MARSRNAVIAAAFGLVYVVVNARVLATAPATVLRVLAVVVFVVVVIARLRSGGERADDGGGAAVTPFGRSYRIVVAAEVAALVIGLVVLSGPLHAGRAAVAWVSLVVGGHFFALARVWGRPALNLLGAGIAACGVVGLVLAAAGLRATPIAVVAGVVPGGLLLAAAVAGLRPQLRRN